MDSRSLAQHLRFYQELGVTGISRDPSWRRRTESAIAEGDDTDGVSEVPPIDGDPNQIEQAVVNLAVNARDAMPDGGRLGLVVSVVDTMSAWPSPSTSSDR